MPSKWYVITGSASSGKTTVINSLSKMGYLTVPEAARLLINEEMKKGKTVGEIRGNEAEFQKKVLEIKINAEKELPRDKTVFFDRGIPDSIAYCQVCGLNTDGMLKICKNKVYRKIFMLEQIPFKRDYARTENIDTVNKLHLLIRKAYSDLGYEIVDVPTMPVEDRIKMILSNID